jgi:hypothetical protein
MDESREHEHDDAKDFLPVRLEQKKLKIHDEKRSAATCRNQI